MKKNPVLTLLGIVAAAAALAGAAFGIWKLLQRKHACSCEEEDLPDFSEDFDLDDEPEGEADGCCADDGDIDLDIHVDDEEKPEE